MQYLQSKVSELGCQEILSILWLKLLSFKIVLQNSTF